MFVIDIVVALTVALTTAFGGLVAEDLVTKDSSCSVHELPELWSESCTSPSRLWWFLGSAAVLVATLALRSWLLAHNGTLYYLRLLPAESADRMRAAVDLAHSRSLDFRSATGWFGTRGPVVDLRAEVAAVSGEFERAMNDDDDATGFVIAPNLAFPAALAVGYGTLLRARTHLAELPERPRRRRLPGGDTGVRTIYFDDGDDTWAERRWHSRRASTATGLELTTVTEPPPDPAAVRRVWLSIQLDGHDGPPATVDHDHPLRHGCEVVAVLAPPSTVGETGAEVIPAWTLPAAPRIPGTSGRHVDRRDFARLVEELSGAIEQVLDEHPEAHVLLCGRMPRSVAFALGYVVSQRKDDRIEGKRARHRTRAEDSRAERAQAEAENAGLSSLSRFWTSVTPVLVHLGEAKPALVHSAQPSDVVVELAGAVPPEGMRRTGSTTTPPP